LRVLRQPPRIGAQKAPLVRQPTASTVPRPPAPSRPWRTRRIERSWAGNRARARVAQDQHCLAGQSRQWHGGVRHRDQKI